jgi:aminoglycoside N3'-acetyltransferase
MSTLRERFEAWYSDGGKWPRAIECNGGAYKLAQTQSAWEAWQAAEASREKEIAELKAALERITKIENQYVGSDWEEIEQARDIAQEALELVEQEETIVKEDGE